MRDFQDPGLIPPKPQSRPQGLTWLMRVKRFRSDMFSSQPERLYDAKMAEMRVGWLRSFFVNTPEDARRVLSASNENFPKSGIVSAGLRDLLGNSVFVSNGQDWARARRIIDPVFGTGKEAFPAIHAAGEAAVQRLSAHSGRIEIEAECSRIAADVMFRAMFSRSISDDQAALVFAAFQDYQRTQPLWNIADILRLPSFVPRFRNRKSRQAAKRIRALLSQLVEQRLASPRPWPKDMLTGLIDGRDPESGQGFEPVELIDQLAIFFLAGHETSASALSWGLYLLARDEAAQDRVAREAADFEGAFSHLSGLAFTRNVFRETLRLYPPVPMMLRDAGAPWQVRGRDVPKGALIVLSPWHLGRHRKLWDGPDCFDPDRWERGVPKGAFIPFSAGPRVCAGAGLAMAEGVALLAILVRSFEFEAQEPPRPVAHLTLRSDTGIYLKLRARV